MQRRALLLRRAAIADRSASAQFLPRWFFVECCLRQHYGIAAWFYQPAQTHKVTNQRDLSATVSNGASMTATRSTHNEVEPEDSLLELSRKHDSAEIEHAYGSTTRPARPFSSMLWFSAGTGRFTRLLSG